ncbi:MAG: hypothetical protein EOP33_06525 [Rickettsiaceae bacterium]|nr:MAG: hypothetical protein EOP33_06525 [Rickettsiaceae bacterium]
MLYLFLLLLIIVFSNQYLLFNEELFIILAFFSLCFFVKTNLGGLVESELKERKNKILNSYLEFLNKKSKYSSVNSKNIESKINYLSNFAEIQKNFFNKFESMLEDLKTQNIVEITKGFETIFILYFANLVSNKRKFL